MERITAFFQRITRTGHKSAHSGQAIILIGVAALGLIATMGLAIDGGRLLFLRREAQTAADAAAIAAARSLCNGTDYEKTAYAAAAANGFDNNEVDNWVTVSSPPQDYYASKPSGIAVVSRSMSDTSRDYLHSTLTLASLSGTTSDTSADSAPMVDPCAGCYVEVEVKGQIPASFIGVVYDGPLEATSSAVGICSPDITGGSNAANLRALWAKGKNCPNASVSVTGSTTEIIGGVHSNGILQINAGGGDHLGQVVGPASYVKDIKNQNKVDWLIGDDVNTTIITSSGLPCSSSCFNTADGADADEYPNINPYQTEALEDWPVDFDISNYEPDSDSDIVAEAKAKGEYYEYPCSSKTDVMDSNWLSNKDGSNPYGQLLRDDNTLKDGIYYSECGIHTGHGGQGWDDLTGNVTFVSEGEIHIDGARHNLKPYVDNLLVYTTDDKKGIHFSGSSNHWEGIIFVPNSDFQTSGSSNGNQINSCIVAQCINFSGSNNRLNCQPTEPKEPQPGIWLAE